MAQNLATFLETNSDASELQRSAGTAIQRACGRLSAEDGFQLPDGSALRDLFLRCNELVQTAQAIQAGEGRARDLGLTSSELLTAIQQIAPEELFSQSTVSTRVSNGQFANISGRLNALRLGGRSAAIGGRVAGLDSTESGSASSYVAFDGTGLRGGAASGDPDVAGSRMGWFVEGSFNTGDRDQTRREDAFDFDATSITLGLDYMLDSGVIGVSVGHDNYQADFDTAQLVTGGGVDVDGTSGSLFGAFYRGNAYLDGIVSFGSLDSDTSRRVVYAPAATASCPPSRPCTAQDDLLVGNTDGEFLAAGATVGYDVNRGSWDISTTLSLAYRDIELDGFTEIDSAGGGLALSFDDQNIESFRSILGLSLSGNYSREFGVLSPLLRLEWHHEFEDGRLPVIAKYALEDALVPSGQGVFSLNPENCFSCFRIESDEIDTDFGLIGVGVSAVFSRRVQVYATYDVLVGADNLSSNAFSLGLRGQF